MLLLLGDVVAPLFAAMGFALLGLSVRTLAPVLGSNWRNFAVFLLAFSLFLAGRPVQLLVGEQPGPLLVNSLRFLLLASVCGPNLALAAEAGLGRPRRLYLLGGLLGASYVLFHMLGSQGSSVVLEVGGLILRDNTVPAWQAPWFGREVSMIAQTLIPLVFFVPTGLHLRRNGSSARQVRIGDGILIFAACMIIGSLLHAWWLIYVGALPCLALWAQAIHGDLLDRLQRLQATHVLEQQQQQATPELSDLPDDNRVAAAGDWITQHLDEDLRVDDIAAAVGMSPSHLQHLFRQHRDCTINQYVQRQRIARAQELLRETKDSVTAIAFAVGFNDSNYFSTVFRKQVGMSPSAWRKQG